MKKIIIFLKLIQERLNWVYNFFQLWFKHVSYEKCLKIYGKISIHGSGKIIMGKYVTINSSSESNPTSGFHQTYLRTEQGGEICIGNHVGISNACITAFRSVTVADNVMIGSGVKIWDTDFHPLDYADRVQGNENIVSEPVTIKKGAFIGACSIILKGVTIGERSIIGAGSVVTRDVPDDEIWAGNPAKFIRKLEKKAKEK